MIKGLYPKPVMSNAIERLNSIISCAFISVLKQKYCFVLFFNY